MDSEMGAGAAADRAPRRFRGSADDAVDVGIALLLVVCTLRYFENHAWDAWGICVAVLAVAVVLAYAVAVIGASFGRSRTERSGVLVAAAIWCPLVIVAPSYGWCAFALFFALHRVLRGAAATGASAVLVASVSVGLFIMSRGQDLGLVLGPLLGGVVLSVVYRALERSLAEQRTLVRDLRTTRAQLASSERAAGALAERNRVASDLHDTAVQSTASALLLLETARQSQGPEPVAVVEARRVLKQALSETRRVLHGLVDGSGGETMSKSLRRLAEEYNARLTMDGEEVPMSDMSMQTLLRVVQEALRNARTHAAASSRSVHLSFGRDAVDVSVHDDGIGFDVDAQCASAVRGGYGLRAMAWRVDRVGGQFSLCSRPGAGTTVRAVVPISLRGLRVAGEV